MREMESPEEAAEHARYKAACSIWTYLEERSQMDYSMVMDGIAYFIGRTMFENPENWKIFERAVKEQVRYHIEQQGSIH